MHELLGPRLRDLTMRRSQRPHGEAVGMGTNWLPQGIGHTKTLRKPGMSRRASACERLLQAARALHHDAMDPITSIAIDTWIIWVIVAYGGLLSPCLEPSQANAAEIERLKSELEAAQASGAL